jgi:predicted acylesterase/phospholipase RssA
MVNSTIPDRQRVLILQGGGALAAYEAGVFEALSEQLSKEDTDRPLFDIIAGTSGGAINAALLVSYFRDNKTWKGAAERLSNYWRNISVDLSKEVDFWIRWWNEEHRDDPNAASYEAARRYYSTKHLLQNGVDGKFPKPKIIVDEKFFDNHPAIPNNIWIRYEKDLLRKGIEDLNFPISTNYKEGEPRLLVVSTDVKDGSTVTFDSYATTSEAGDYHTDTSAAGYSKHTSRHSGGVQLSHVMASSSIPLFYDFEIINREEYCDGGVLSNTPLREVLQAHRDYWYKDVGREKPDSKVPALEIFIVGVWPSKGDDDSTETELNFDEVKERLYDINLSDKTIYDEKVAVVVSDYIDIIKRITELALSKMGSKEKKDSLQKDIDSFYNELAQSRGRDGERRIYGSLIQGRTRISDITRIECKADRDSISNKSFDITTTTIENLIDQGRMDAKNVLQKRSKE